MAIRAIIARADMADRAKVILDAWHSVKRTQLTPKPRKPPRAAKGRS